MSSSLSQPLMKSLTLQNEALDFITAGVGCNCLVTLFETGALKVLNDKGYFTKKGVQSVANPLCVKS